MVDYIDFWIILCYNDKTPHIGDKHGHKRHLFLFIISHFCRNSTYCCYGSHYTMGNRFPHRIQIHCKRDQQNIRKRKPILAPSKTPPDTFNNPFRSLSQISYSTSKMQVIRPAFFIFRNPYKTASPYRGERRYPLRQRERGALHMTQAPRGL